MDVVFTKDAPRPAGHYSQAVVHGGLVFVAGQLALDPENGDVVGVGDPGVQTERALRNVQAILEASGSGLEWILSLTVYVVGGAAWPDVNSAVARVLGEHRPARAVIPVPELRRDCLVEIQAVAAVRPMVL